jgi:hypothetical protein
MKKLNSIVLAGVLAAFTAPASAQFYIGAGLGKGKATDTTTSTTTPSGVPVSVSGGDDSKTSWQLNGGYLFTPEWGVEVQYTDLNKRNGTVTFGAPVNGTATLNDVKAYQYGIAGTYTMPIDDKWFARGKLGVSSNHVDSASATIGAGTYSTSSSSKTDLLAGIAAGYRWNQNFATRLEYEYFGKFETNNGRSSGKGNNIGLRMQYFFK